MATTYEDIATMISCRWHPDRIAAEIGNPRANLATPQRADLLEQIGRTLDQARGAYHARQLDIHGGRDGMVETAYSDFVDLVVCRLGEEWYVPAGKRDEVRVEIGRVVDSLLADWGSWEPWPLDGWRSWRREAARRTQACERFAVRARS